MLCLAECVKKHWQGEPASLGVIAAAMVRINNPKVSVLMHVSMTKRIVSLAQAECGYDRLVGETAQGKDDRAGFHQV